MSTTKSFAGQSFNLPNNREPKSSNWGTHTSNFLIAVADNALSKTGGTFTLSAEMSFGATYGLLLPYLKSASANISSTGVIRFANNEGMGWRNAANNADLLLKVNASNVLEYNGNPITALALGAANTVLKMNSGGTATEYGKITTNNIDASAGIVDTQLATISTAGKVSNSATTATDANTANAIVARDASGNFTAGTITAALNGNASTVTTNANLTGVVTSVGNATSIADGALALAKLATTTAGYIPVGAATTGIPTYVAMSGDATLASTGAITLATVPVAKGGTGQTTAALAFDALSPMTTNGDLITRAAGTGARIAAGTDGQVLGMVSGAPAWTDGGGGSGEKNYITNHSAKSAITGWTNVGDLDVARTTTAGDLPREYTTASGIKITADSNTQSTADYVYYDFTLDDVDLSKKLKIQWSQKTTGTYTAGDLAVVITTQADRTTALHTPITTAIPAVDGVFTTYFDASTTATLSLVIRATTDMTTDGGIVISDVVVGPGVGVQGAVVGEWQSYTPSSSGFGSISVIEAKWRRNGDAMDVIGKFTTVAVAASQARINLPTGHTTASGASAHAVGRWYRDNITANTRKSGPLLRLHTSANYLVFGSDDYTTAAGPFNAYDGNAIASNSENVGFYFSTPIAEWVGSGTVNLAQNDVEYASNSDDTATASVTASGFQYGPNGAPFSSNWAIGTSYTRGIQFQTAIQPTDRFEVEVSEDSGVTWLPASDGGGNICSSMIVQGTSYYGVQVRSLSSTAVKVIFYANGRSPSNATYAGNGSAWSTLSGGVNRWRVRKISGGQAVGFGEVNPGVSSGLVSANGLKGKTNGVAVAAGYIGEKLVTSTTSLQLSSSYTVICTLTLTPGVWLVHGVVLMSSIPNTRYYVDASITTSSGSIGTLGLNRTIAHTGVSGSGSTASTGTAVVPAQYFNVSTSTPIYLNGGADVSSGYSSDAAYFIAVRIA